jgi:DNA-binding MarR family transcriptional regulator
MIGKPFIDTFVETKKIVSLISCRAIAPLGIGAAQVALLRELGRIGNATQGALARAAAVDQSAAARAFTSLDRRGWIRRKRGTRDRRESIVELTPLGKRLLKRVEAIHASTAELIESHLDARDHTDLERICAKLAALVVDEVEPPPSRTTRRRR